MNHKFKETEYINSVQSSIKSVGVSIPQYNCKYAHSSIQSLNTTGNMHIALFNPSTQL